MQLAVPLSVDQIRIAGRLSAMLEQGSENDRALLALAARFPGFDADATLLKVVTLNALYGTQIYAVNRMARYVYGVLNKTELSRAGPELVDTLARLPTSRPDEKARVYVSFASKFAHIFIDPERFPILDSYAEWMVAFHLGKANLVRDPSRYTAFVQNLARLRDLIGWNGTNRELDDYLWFAGQYREWRRGGRINAEARRFFENPPPGVAAELESLCLSFPGDHEEKRHVQSGLVGLRGRWAVPARGLRSARGVHAVPGCPELADGIGVRARREGHGGLRGPAGPAL